MMGTLRDDILIFSGILVSDDLPLLRAVYPSEADALRPILDSSGLYPLVFHAVASASSISKSVGMFSFSSAAAREGASVEEVTVRLSLDEDGSR
jgi:hypothetical protein